MDLGLFIVRFVIKMKLFYYVTYLGVISFQKIYDTKIIPKCNTLAFGEVFDSWKIC